MTGVTGRFVAIGDSFTEGVGDWNPAYPNGVRGWADRVAKQLGKQDPGWQYANLARRSWTLDQIVAEQLEPALRLEPTVVAFFAGGNDLLQVRVDVPDLLRRYDAALARIRGEGARPLMFTAYDLRLSPVLEPLRLRNNAFNRGIRHLAVAHGALLVDHWAMRVYAHPWMWEPDRLHMSRLGHRHLAAAVLQSLRVEHTLHLAELAPAPRPTWRQRLRAEQVWWEEWVAPSVQRRRRGTPTGWELGPKWPDLIHPAEGLKRLARQRTAEPAPHEADPT
jgi:lysophospholipase L1-like esterase